MYKLSCMIEKSWIDHLVDFHGKYILLCKSTDVGDAGFSLCGGLVKTTKSLSAF